MIRQTSSSSHVSRSPSDTSQKAGPQKRQHVVGHGRMPTRNHSFGKNLNKLNKQLTAAHTQANAGDGTAAKHHRRTQSGNSNSAPSSPRPGFKRNASSGGIVRATHQAHAHPAIRKNHSSGHLARQGSSKNVLKSSKNDVAPPKRSLAQPGKARHQSPDTHPTVHFDMGDDGEEGPDDGWTEESASQSPTTTRSNTRSNSVILDPQKAAGTAREQVRTGAEGSQTQPNSYQQLHPPPNAMAYALPDRSHNPRPTNGGNSNHHSRPPDADIITSRLLQRSASHNAPPQMSSIEATVVSGSHDARILSQSAGSTLFDTPGRDVVSRFMDGDGSAGTPKDSSSFLPSRNSPAGGSDFDQAKRNQSMPDVAGTTTPSREHARRSGTTTPTTNLPPSRTQQKLMLQRASSNIEPQKLIPVILPRTGGPTFLQTGMTYAASAEGRLDPRLQQQFNHVAVEYKVVRRYRNPLVDAVVRIQQIPGVSQKTRAATKSAGANGYVNVHGSSSLSTSFNETGVETDGTGSRRSRVSFENGRAGGSRDEGDMEGRQSFESEHERTRTSEAEEICRRLWESTEVVEGD